MKAVETIEGVGRIMPLSLKNLFGPQTSRVALRPSGVSFEAKSNMSILEAALAQGIAFPHSCTVGTCGSCKCKLKEGRIRELTDFAYILSGEELRSGIVLACQAAPRGDVVLEIEGVESRHLHPAGDFKGRIVETRNLTHDVKSVRVQLDKTIEFDAGQYASIDVPGIFGKRAYSFASAPQSGGTLEIEFWVRHVPGGAFTDRLFSEDVTGAELEIHAPLGNFWLREGDGPIIGIAGGSGLAPLLSMMEAAAAAGVNRECALLFGARRERDLYALERIDAIAKAWKAPFHFHPVLSEEEPTSGWSGARGIVTEFIDGAFGRTFPAGTQAYMCGPPGMIDAAIPNLKGVSIAPKDIHFDKFLDARDNIRRQA